MRTALLLAPLPAIAGSVLLMREAGVGTSAWVQQIVVAAVCLLVCLVVVLRKRPARSQTRHHHLIWLAGIAAILVLLPVLLSTAAGPQRWISFPGVRLYVASCLLPMALLCLAAAPPKHAVVLTLWAGIMALVLALQPDAAQATAFSVAACAALFMLKVSTPLKTSAFIVLVICTAWAWSQPDPLQPVPHVEGVLDLARAAGPLALAAALVSLAIPLACLVREASRHSGLFVVALYYACIYGLASMQVTPMPFLGFGAGPIIGHFGLVLLYTHVRGGSP